MRRTLSIGCLLIAWLCANGAVWNVVQVVAWGKMFHDYSEAMAPGEALSLTFDGTKPCDLCHIAQSAEDTARQQQPREADLGGSTEKLLLLSDDASALVVTAPEFCWPGLDHDAGFTRTESVPVPPPRRLS